VHVPLINLEGGARKRSLPAVDLACNADVVEGKRAKLEMLRSRLKAAREGIAADVGRGKAQQEILPMEVQDNSGDTAFLGLFAGDGGVTAAVVRLGLTACDARDIASRRNSSNG
jgi:hypothetical protein